jgi:Lar family restriction alleviation protein
MSEEFLSCGKCNGQGECNILIGRTGCGDDMFEIGKCDECDGTGKTKLESLKPCPFCKCDSYLKMWDRDDYYYLRYKVICHSCKIKTPFYESQSEAEEAWNNRV